MEIHRKYKLEKAVSKDPHREQLHNIFIRGKKAIATTGHILAAVPVKIQKNDTPGLVSVDALKLGRKATPSGFDEIRIELDGKQILQDGTTLPRPEGEPPSQLDSVIHDAQKKRKFKFGIDVGLLKDLCDAIGETEIILELQAPDKAILVRPYNNGDERGIIMPLRIREEK